jgi:FixJ family two-component response regulator
MRKKSKKQQKQRIFFVDDEPKIRDVVGETLKESGFEVSCFSCAADCLERLRSRTCDLLITDVKMPDMDGMELLTETQRFAPWLPVLLVTGYGDVPMAATAFKAGAVDFVEKPLNRKTLLSAVELVLKRINPLDPILGKTLTRTEKRVLRLILDGKTNKEIAYIFGRAVKTIEVHRSRIMRKLDVGNAVDLVKRAAVMGLVEMPANE